MTPDWPTLGDYAALVLNNNRSKAYLQNLIRSGYSPVSAIVLKSSTGQVAGQTESDGDLTRHVHQKAIRACPEVGIDFDEKEHVITTLERAGVPYAQLETIDVNSAEVVSAVAELESPYVVYSGPGGAILRSDVLGVGRFFIHAHPGWLPDFGGSTTLYYSLLFDGSIGVSVIVLTDQIDRGPVFLRQHFSVESSRDFDYVVDPAVRTASLLSFFRDNWDSRPKPLDLRDEGDGSVFYIIHPVLKHKAVLKRVAPQVGK